ncbi:MAG: hypothetical protein IJ535_10775 [Pseudobutyrivibrio sp.]|uniref:hypothetical protein n=1 Tax=Pseudobutyrivibrio sp. TaxID=2014367 RepID=UPI0025E56222|nr:hypothetical protein [Pseudobutyrivibrio sp.]MBQ8490251.1 hypothetical protein [Pseudobutyrivibrio sp.]
MKHDKEKSNSSLWVNCPACGNRILRANFGRLQYHCKCGVDFTACIADSVVTTVVTDGNENVSMTEQLDKYRHQFDSCLDG